MNGNPLAFARLSLLGLSVGDAYGERCFSRDPAEVAARIEAGQVPPGSLRWTDDTAMAVSVVENLEARGRIDADTTCAIVGGIVVLSAPGGMPAAWARAAEPLPGFEYSRR